MATCKSAAIALASAAERSPAWYVATPDSLHVSTSFVERQNLTMRMGLRRLTRLTNGFSKKIENLEHAVAQHFMHYNSARIHKTLRVTPAMAAALRSATAISNARRSRSKSRPIRKWSAGCLTHLDRLVSGMFHVKRRERVPLVRTFHVKLEHSHWCKMDLLTPPGSTAIHRAPNRLFP